MILKKRIHKTKGELKRTLLRYKIIVVLLAAYILGSHLGIF
ncbi:hypothetical protein [uncultured Ilyobacter sp.]|nr:hypothetical protein [uncultured Ilyobacter sp.]